MGIRIIFARRRAIGEKRAQALLGLVLFTTVLLGAARFSFAQEPPRPTGYYKTFPLKSVDTRAVMTGVSASTNLPLFNYRVVSPVDGHTYKGMIVGRSPFFHGARTTAIKTIIVPIIVKTTDGGVFDPTKADATCAGGSTPLSLAQNSPIFLNHDYVFNGVDVGSSQYLGAFQRANFWSHVQATGARYQFALSPVTVVPAVTFSPAVGHGKMYAAHTFFGQNCGEGVIDINVLQPFLQNTVIPSLAAQGVGPTTFPFFVLYNVVQAQGGDNIFSNCCILGFHSAFGSLSALQTYGIADFELSGVFADSQNSSTLAHEVGEWMDDPVGDNPTPLWGHIGQVSGCQGNLETGDPLSGTNIPGVLMPNGFIYNLQELAFFSWFYRQNPSLGTSGDFSDNGTFAQDAGPVCF